MHSVVDFSLDLKRQEGLRSVLILNYCDSDSTWFTKVIRMCKYINLFNKYQACSQFKD